MAGVAEPFTGEVYAIEPRIDPATRTLRLRARSENPRGKVLPGGFATVEMSLREIPNALMVPADALVAGLNDQRVYVLENGQAQERKVQTGLRLSREVQIVSGLEPGATVITSGQLQLRPGVRVQAVKRPQTPEQPARLPPRLQTPIPQSHEPSFHQHSAAGPRDRDVDRLGDLWRGRLHVPRRP